MARRALNSAAPGTGSSVGTKMGPVYWTLVNDPREIMELGRSPDVPAGSAASELMSLVYGQLRHIAEIRLGGKGGQTLQATALVHEVYLKLQDHPSILTAERGRFFAVAAEAMRQILIDHARSKGCQKRGGALRRSMTDVADLAAEADSGAILALDEAISRLEGVESVAAKVVKLRFFAGLSVQETADATGLSVRTVHREWKFARAWLYNALE